MEIEYTLYLDEIQANDPYEYFCLAGVIIKNELYKDIETCINEIKKRHFETTEVILHEVDIRRAPNNKGKTPNEKIIRRFMRKEESKESYFKDLVSFFKNNEFVVLSASLHQRNSKETYPKHRDKYFMTLQILLENFTHFLIEHNGVGNIVIESRRSQHDTSLDDLLDMHFHKLRCLTGTLFYNAQTISKYIKRIEFKEKKSNHIGIQIADMIPNSLNRHLSNQPQVIEGLYEEIEKKTYAGERNNKMRFGKKVLVKN